MQRGVAVPWVRCHVDRSARQRMERRNLLHAGGRLRRFEGSLECAASLEMTSIADGGNRTVDAAATMRGSLDTPAAPLARDGTGSVVVRVVARFSRSMPAY